jgi:geranyl-CoA carboxylase beta subunit
VFLAGPPLVKAAIGEDTTEEELGGAVTHAQVTGLGEHLCEDDAHAIAMAREIVDKLHWGATPSPAGVVPPRYPGDELLGVVPADEREPYDVREVIARLVDGSDFLELKPDYATDTVCGHARIGGHVVGLVGNNGPIQPTARSRPRSSSSCATSAPRRSCSCRTPRDTWSAPPPSTAARSSTDPR